MGGDLRVEACGAELDMRVAGVKRLGVLRGAMACMTYISDGSEENEKWTEV